MTAEHITPNDPRFERIGLTGYGDGLIYRPDEERFVETPNEGCHNGVFIQHVVRIGECWADVHGLDIFRCDNFEDCKAMGLSGRIFGVRWWLPARELAKHGLKGRAPTWSEQQEGVCVDTNDNEGETMMVGMAHGVDAHNEAMGSPLVAGYCDECGLERGAGHHCCRCDDDHDYWGEGSALD